MDVLSVSGLTKYYGTFLAVDNVSFTIKEGEIVGLLGPNGAGKTSTIQMLLGLTIPTDGEIAYFDKDFFKHREEILERINYASSYSHVQARITVRQNLEIYARLYGLGDAQSRIQEVLSLLEVEQVATHLFWKLSSGQKTRVMLAKALLNRPKIILMDEPTSSLDPEIASKVLEVIRELQERERVSILYTSHNMVEVERICDRVIFLYKGKIIAEDTPLGLTKRVGRVRLVLTFEGEKATVASYLETKSFTHAFPRDHVVVVELSDREVPKALFGLSKSGVWLTDIDIERPDLEDVFLSFAKRGYETTPH